MAKMRSYQAARSAFSLLEFLCWSTIVFGFVLMMVGVAAGRQFGGLGSGGEFFGPALAATPGVVVMIIGLVGVASVQNGRASVDSAEYGQQMLQLARDQLAISRQSLRQQSGATPGSFGEAISTASEPNAPAPEAEPDGPSYANFQSSRSQENGSPSQTPATPPLAAFEHRGFQVAADTEGYVFDGYRFQTAEAVTAYIDQHAPQDPLKLGGVTRRGV